MHFLPGNLYNKVKGLSHSPFAFHLPSGYIPSYRFVIYLYKPRAGAYRYQALSIIFHE